MSSELTGRAPVRHDMPAGQLDHPVTAGLWELRNVAITSYNGTRGTICGPWPAEKHLAAPVITVRMIPSDPSNSCRAFSVLLKGTG